MKGAPSWLVLWASRAPVQEIFFLPWLLLSALLTLHYYNSFVPIAQQAGQGHAAVQGRLSLSMYFWLKLRQIGTLGVHMKGVPSWLVRWACRAGTRDFVLP